MERFNCASGDMEYTLRDTRYNLAIHEFESKGIDYIELEIRKEDEYLESVLLTIEDTELLIIELQRIIVEKRMNR